MTEKSGIHDATCLRCKKRFSWTGRVADRPACPQCGQRPAQDELWQTEAKIEALCATLVQRREASQGKAGKAPAAGPDQIGS
jgi:hypothetical protein